jgi:formate dehydrogenase subunit gamma
MTRMLHPWFSLGFVLFFALQFLNWLEHMTWTPDDSRWLRRLKEYVTNPEKPEPEYVGFFNAGQKLYFWSITVCAVVFMITGIAMWFPEIFGRWIVAISYVLHDLAAIVMLVGICAFIAEDSVAPLFAFSMPSSTPSTSLPSGLKPVTRGKTSPRDL